MSPMNPGDKPDYYGPSKGILSGMTFYYYNILTIFQTILRTISIAPKFQVNTGRIRRSQVPQKMEHVFTCLGTSKTTSPPSTSQISNIWAGGCRATHARINGCIRPAVDLDIYLFFLAPTVPSLHPGCNPTLVMMMPWAPPSPSFFNLSKRIGCALLVFGQPWNTFR